MSVLDGARRDGNAEMLPRMAHLHMQAIHICYAVHGDCLEPQLFARSDDAHSNLPSVGNEHFGERCHWSKVAAVVP